MLAVNLGESPETVRKFMKEMRLTFPALLDRYHRVGNLYDIKAHPTRFIIDRRGNAVAKGTGYQDWFSDEARHLINSLLAY